MAYATDVPDARAIDAPIGDIDGHGDHPGGAGPDHPTEGYPEDAAAPRVERRGLAALDNRRVRRDTGTSFRGNNATQ